jgi:hypothetical protein
LNREFREKDGVVRLPSQNSEHFASYVQWLYSGVLYCQIKSDAGVVQISPEFARLFDMYILGDEIQDESFQNAIIDSIIELVEFSNQLPIRSPDISHIFDNLPPMSPLRKLLVDLCVYLCDSKWLENVNFERYPKEFWFEVTKGLTPKESNAKSRSLPWQVDRGQYYVHEKD